MTWPAPTRRAPIRRLAAVTAVAVVATASPARADPAPACIDDGDCGAGAACVASACVDTTDCAIRGGCARLVVPLSVGYAHGFTTGEPFEEGHVFNVAIEVALQVAFTPWGVPVDGDGETVHGPVVELALGGTAGHFVIPPVAVDGAVVALRPMVRTGWELSWVAQREPLASAQDVTSLQLLYGAGLEHRAGDDALAGTGFAHGPVVQLAWSSLHPRGDVAAAPFVRVGAVHTPGGSGVVDFACGPSGACELEWPFVGAVSLALSVGVALQ